MHLQDLPLIFKSVARWLFVLALSLLLATRLANGATGDTISLSVGDVVTFDFLDDALPAEQLTIASDGRITLPLLGGFEVAGKTVAQASTTIRSAFINRHYLIDPQFSLAITTFRPIFVLGDVKSPGSFAFQPFLNLEQAVALAGGQATGGVTGEDRVVARARLRGDLDQGSVEIGREAVAAARVTAQLEGRTEIRSSDIPQKVQPILSADLEQTLMPTEQRILEADHRAYQTRVGQLTDAIGEVTGALTNLNQLVENQKLAIGAARADFERIKSLAVRGIKTLSDLSNVQRDQTAQESHLLEILNEMSTTRRELGDLQRQLVDATDTRTHDALVELQLHKAEIEKLWAVRQAKQEQILLLSNIVAEAEQSNSTVVFGYQIRRYEDGTTTTRSASLGDPVKPGDTIIVTIDRKTGTATTTSVGNLAENVR